MLSMDGEVGAHLHVETRKDVEMLGSLSLKQDRSGPDEDSWRPTKIFKPNEFEFDFYSKNALPQPEADAGGYFSLRSGSMVPRDDSQTMLCFSASTSTKSHQPSFLSTASGDDCSRNHDFFSRFQAHQPTFCAKGSFFGRCHEGGRYGAFCRYRWPFTPSQWMELEHQALIYKHLVANVPVPSNLLIPLKRSLNPYAFSCFSSGSYLSNSLGWGSFHSGFSGNTDPEPGRCRRTDGKKWRCSRDAVPDQKYCERHINRGRHRSRKPVEGQSGHAVSGSTTSKVAPVASSSASVISSNSASSSLGAIHHQFSSSQPKAANPSTEHLISGIKAPDGLSILPPSINLHSKDAPLSAQEQHVAFEDSTHPTFGLVSSDSLLMPSQRSSLINSRNSDSLLSFGGQETHDQHPVRHFIDKWPKEQSNRGSVVWPEELKSDWTQLSMSIPMTCSDFSSSSNSPQEKKPILSALQLARQFDPILMGLSVSNNSDESLQKQSHWLPVSWGNSMGGPLGEVLNNTCKNAGSSESSPLLNLATEGWDSSPQLRSSPTGVLQKSTFISLSNSSAGSSPRGDHPETTANFCDDLLGSTLATSSGIPPI